MFFLFEIIFRWSAYPAIKILSLNGIPLSLLYTIAYDLPIYPSQLRIVHLVVTNQILIAKLHLTYRHFHTYVVDLNMNAFHLLYTPMNYQSQKKHLSPRLALLTYARLYLVIDCLDITLIVLIYLTTFHSTILTFVLMLDV